MICTQLTKSQTIRSREEEKKKPCILCSNRSFQVWKLWKLWNKYINFSQFRFLGKGFVVYKLQRNEKQIEIFCTCAACTMHISNSMLMRQFGCLNFRKLLLKSIRFIDVDVDGTARATICAINFKFQRKYALKFEIFVLEIFMRHNHIYSRCRFVRRWRCTLHRKKKRKKTIPRFVCSCHATHGLCDKIIYKMHSERPSSNAVKYRRAHWKTSERIP